MSWIKGIERKQINWGPTIDPDKCTGCGMCLNCGKNVFRYENGKSIVANYMDCVPGCLTCRSLCEGNAISFPSLKELREVYKQNKVWEKVKAEMVANGKIPAK